MTRRLLAGYLALAVVVLATGARHLRVEGAEHGSVEEAEAELIGDLT